MIRKLVMLGLVVMLAAILLGAKKEEKHQVDPKICIGCGICVQTCPVKAITLVEDAQKAKKALIDPEKCINCGLCASKCPVKAIHGPTVKPAAAAPAAEKKTK